MFRLSTDADPAFLAEMLYEAVYWRDDGAEERPPLNALLTDQVVSRYVEGWGRSGDLAVLALDRRDEPVGAAWIRCYPADRAGYGFVADDVPELSIAVFPEFRGGGVGGLLLGALIARAESAGRRGISLSVADGNPDRRLYERHGFVARARDDVSTSTTMVLILDPSA